jgi:hypothetical protein
VFDELERLIQPAGEAAGAALPDWLADQYQAAGQEAAARLRHLPWPAERNMRRREVLGTGRKAARLLYALRHIRTWCPHLKADSPMPVVAHIDAGWLGCFPCCAATPLTVDADPRCRLCDSVPGNGMYHPMVLAAGPVLYAVEACDACAAEILESR